MRSGDLDNLVLPMISVDEYESKIDKNAIVIGFYVGDKDAAVDLNRFIQKSYVALLDTDISPGPDQHGFYLVFVELLKNDILEKNVKAILDDISPLVNIDEWQMRVRKTKNILPFSEKLLKKAIEKAERIDKENKITEFVANSDFEYVGFEKNRLSLCTNKVKQLFEVLAFGDHSVTEPYTYDVKLEEVCKGNRLQSLFGEGWFVSNTKDIFIIEKDQNYLVLKSMI